jgi:hypothetical protein
LAYEEVRVLARIGPLRTVVGARPEPDGPVIRVVQVDEVDAGWNARAAPDTLTFGLEDSGGTFTPLATLDGKYLSTEVSGGFTGRVIGMYAAAGTVHFDWFDYQPLS